MTDLTPGPSSPSAPTGEAREQWLVEAQAELVGWLLLLRRHYRVHFDVLIDFVTDDRRDADGADVA